MNFALRTGIFLALAFALQASAAQPPPLPSDLLEGGRSGRRLTGDVIVFCIDARDPAHPVDKAIGEAIADALLLKPEFYLVERTLVIEEFENVYVDLVDHCHAYLGFKLLSETYANWVILTRAYYETTYLMVVKNQDWQSLTDIPRDLAVGGVPGSPGDLRLLSYLNSLPQDERWPRHPRGSHEQALDAVNDESLAGALVWAPAYWELQSSRPEYAELSAFEVEGVSLPVGVGAVLLSGNDFLRLSLDDAIRSLVSEGQIGDILESFDFPARPPDLR